ncbi:hypothetical protein SESBI_29178 [Sesbania bispinosa]|nr:hypothetical protein SESBI_29178 [Sesbania bispinosa]
MKALQLLSLTHEELGCRVCVLDANLYFTKSWGASPKSLEKLILDARSRGTKPKIAQGACPRRNERLRSRGTKPEIAQGACPRREERLRSRGTKSEIAQGACPRREERLRSRGTKPEIAQGACPRREALCGILRSHPYVPSIFSPYYYMDEWDISHPEGLPTSENGENFAIWVLDWMSMADGFSTNISPQMNEKHVRMRLAIDLVNGRHNEYWEEIKGKAEAFWKSIRTPKTV